MQGNVFRSLFIYLFFFNGVFLFISWQAMTYLRQLMNLCAVSSRSAALAQRDVGFGMEDEVGEEDEELKRALALSRQDIDVEDEEADLRRAIQLSMQGEK